MDTSPGDRALAAMLRVPLFWRVALSLLIVAVLAAAFLLVRYQEGSARLSVGGFGFSAPVNVGEEVHMLLEVDTGAEEVILESARALGVEPGLEAEVRLVRSPMAPLGGTIRGPLDTTYEVVPLADQAVGSSEEGPYALDLRLVATEPGIHTVSAVEVTYSAGFLRTRTMRANAKGCLSASSDWQSDDRECPLPD